MARGDGVKAAESAVGIAGKGQTEARNDRGLIGALSGNEAGREREVACRTRRVVLASLGVMKEQRAEYKRGRSLALAWILVLVLALGPFVWKVAEDLIGGDRLSGLNCQFSLLWVCILCPALLAAVLVAGWVRNRP